MAVRAALWILAVIVVLSAIATSGPSLRTAAAAPHDPIFINGNAEFNASNGVVGGAGTPSDPFVIAGWTVSGSTGTGVQIRNTDAYAVVRNVSILGSFAGVYLYNVLHVSLVNLTAEANQQFGIQVDASRAVVVSNSTVMLNANGIIVSRSSDVQVLGNLLYANTENGVYVTSSTNSSLVDNAVVHNALTGGYGVSLEASLNLTVNGNQFTANGIHLAGSAADQFDSHTIGADNLVDGSPILYEKDCVQSTFDGLVLGELIIARCADLRATNLSIRDADVGIELAYARNVTIGPNVTITNATTAIELVSSSTVTVEGARLVDTGYGLLVSAFTGLRFSGNDITAPFWPGLAGDGISLTRTTDVNMTGNVVRHHRAGLFASLSSNLSVVEGTFMENAGIGLDANGSSDLFVAGTVFATNAGGIRLVRSTNSTLSGNLIEANAGAGVDLLNSTGIVVAGNVFRNNLPNARDNFGPENAWDLGPTAGGNYWSDYSGVDSDGDGIGDTPYTIDANSTDNFPLMAPRVALDAPPEALFALSPSVGTAVTVFRGNATASSDLEDLPSTLEVRWDWNGDGIWDTPWSSERIAAHRYPAVGTYTVRMEVRDTANLTDVWTEQATVVPKPDNLPPSVEVFAPSSVSVGEGIPIRANVSDPSGVTNVTLFYRGTQDVDYRPLRMTRGTDTNWSVTLPAQSAPGTVGFYIVANDTWENEARAPLAGVQSVSVTDTLTPLVVTVGIILVAAALAGFLLVRARLRSRPPDSSASRGEPTSKEGEPKEGRPPGNP